MQARSQQKDIMSFLFLLAKGVPKFAPDLKDHAILGIWCEALKFYAPETLNAAATRILSTETEFPSLARIKDVLGAADKETFDDLVALISKYGGYRAPQDISYAMAMTINRLGGWQRICDWTNDELPFRRKDFQDCYEATTDILAIADPKALFPIKLLGAHTTATIQITGAQNQTLLGEGVLDAANVPKDEKIDWEAISAAHSDIDLNIPDRIKERGFFRLKEHPGMWFRYCFGMKPGSSIPYSFVDADEHVANAKTAQQRKAPLDPNKFDSSKYDVSTFVD